MVGFLLDVLLRLLWVFVNMIFTLLLQLIIIIAIVTCGSLHCTEYMTIMHFGVYKMYFGP